MECKIPSALFILIVLSLVLQNKLTSANICASNPTVISGSANGKFSSPNYPNNYPRNTIKTWKIVAPSHGQVIDLYFNVFVLERSSSCQRDYVKIRGKCDDVVPMAVYCSRTARTLRSNTNVLWVEFRSDSSRNYKGFEAIYNSSSNSSKLLSCPRASDNQANINYCLSGGQVQCCNNGDRNCAVNTLLTAPSGRITSPGYPGNYPHGTLYMWRITVPEGYVVQLNFTTLVIHNSRLCSKCNCDYVAAHDGPCPVYHIGIKWCGGWTSRFKYPSFITTGRHMVVIFKSDRTNNHIGFDANYTRALNCSGATPITCETNGVPSCCKFGSVCVSGTSTRSRCPRSGDPSSHTGCCTVNGSPSCCPVIQSGISISCPRPSDNPAYLDVCLSGGQQICCNRNRPICRYDVLLTDQSGKIIIPDNYAALYPPNMLIVWRITVPQGFLVQLNFTRLKIETYFICPSGCNCDYVGVRDGPCADITRGRKWCGTSWGRTPSYISTGRHVQVIFKSDSTNNYGGFELKYRRALKCGGDKPYSCLQQGQPSCCRTAGSSAVFSSRTLWVAMVIITSWRILL